MKNLILLLVLSAGTLTAQFSYKVTKLPPVPVAGIIDPVTIDEGFYPSVSYIAAPDHIGNEVARAKMEAVKRYPRKESERVSSRGMADPPIKRRGFDSAVSGSTPTDNTLAVGNDGTNVTGVNRSILFTDENGNRLRAFSLMSFAQGIPGNTNHFDPRAIYDPASDRYVVTWLAGSSSTTSDIFIAFSSSSDVLEAWTVYKITGSPFQTAVWTDYPMFSLTNDAVILTVNLIRDNIGWELGFSETIIYEIEKEPAYNGADDLEVTLYSEVNFGNQPIRNLHPVKSADEFLEDEQYFLSNRNFDITNDTIFILKLATDPTTNEKGLEIDFRVGNEPYGVPPNGVQPNFSIGLQTNDARVLDAFRLEDQIQFVGNTMDRLTGKSAIYYGIIDGLDTDRLLTTSLLTHPSRDLAYPGIAWTGREAGETSAIIVAEHTSETEFAGISALYVNDERDMSDWIDVELGGAFVRGSGSAIRWGDYIGCQRQYNMPGVVWLSAMYTSSIGVPTNYNALLTAPNIEFSSTDNELKKELDFTVAPNPVSERVTVLMDIPTIENLRLALYDVEGREVAVLFEDRAKQIGQMEFSFDLGPLAQGMYFFIATLGNREIESRKIIKN